MLAVHMSVPFSRSHPSARRWEMPSSPLLHAPVSALELGWLLLVPEVPGEGLRLCKLECWSETVLTRLLIPQNLWSSDKANKRKKFEI